ncbi:hypothetical protein DFH06DRAFT_1443050 [Mycena polygramma]|nr:hypothetical protein DFH06DRAFT_1443050 [Mycena polygramma]
MRFTLDEHPNQYVSHADIIAIGTVFAVSTRGGPVIPFRGDRADANIGLNVSEMIQLVACGRTLPRLAHHRYGLGRWDGRGSVRHAQHNMWVTTQYRRTCAGSTAIATLLCRDGISSCVSSYGCLFLGTMSTTDAFASTCTTVLDKMLNRCRAGHAHGRDRVAARQVKASAVQLTVAGSKLQFSASSSPRKAPRSKCTGATAMVMPRTACPRPLDGDGCQPQVPICRPHRPRRVSPSSGSWWITRTGRQRPRTTAGGSDYVIEKDSVLSVPSMSRGKNVLTGSMAPRRQRPTRPHRASTLTATSRRTPRTTSRATPASATGYDFYSGTATDNFGATILFDLRATGGDGMDYVETYRRSGLIGVSLPTAAAANLTASGRAGGEIGAVSLDARWWWVGVAGLTSVWHHRYLYYICIHLPIHGRSYTLRPGNNRYSDFEESQEPASNTRGNDSWTQTEARFG